MHSKLLTALLTGLGLALTLTACGGGGDDNDTGSNFGTISAEDQVRAGTAVAAAQIDGFANSLIIDLVFLENQGPGVTDFSSRCTSGSASSTFVDSDNDTVFNETNTITFNASNCLTPSDLDGEYVYTSLDTFGTSYSVTYNNYSIDGETLSGSLIITENNYNPLSGTGSLTVTIPNTLTLGSQTISNATYVFTLLGSSTYNLKADFTVSTSATDTLTVVTDTTFSGTYAYDSQEGSVVIDDPTVGYLTVTASDNSTVTINANTGNPATLRVGASGVSQEFNW